MAVNVHERAVLVSCDVCREPFELSRATSRAGGARAVNRAARRADAGAEVERPRATGVGALVGRSPRDRGVPRARDAHLGTVTRPDERCTAACSCRTSYSGWRRRRGVAQVGEIGLGGRSKGETKRRPLMGLRSSVGIRLYTARGGGVRVGRTRGEEPVAISPLGDRAAVGATAPGLTINVTQPQAAHIGAYPDHRPSATSCFRSSRRRRGISPSPKAVVTAEVRRARA